MDGTSWFESEAVYDNTDALPAIGWQDVELSHSITEWGKKHLGRSTRDFEMATVFFRHLEGISGRRI